MGKALKSIGKISAPGKRFTARRRLLSGNPKAIAQHNRRVGEVLHAFNVAQASFFVVLWQIHKEDYELASSLWESQSSDLGQRKLLDIFIRQKIARASIRNALIWALGAMNELAEMRNDAVHADMLWYYDQLVPGLATKKSRRERLLQAPLETKWKALRGDLSALANYVNALHVDLMMDVSRPSTKRPRLQLARSTSSKIQNQRRLAKKAVRERQRQSSAA